MPVEPGFQADQQSRLSPEEKNRFRRIPDDRKRDDHKYTSDHRANRASQFGRIGFDQIGSGLVVDESRKEQNDSVGCSRKKARPHQTRTECALVPEERPHSASVARSDKNATAHQVTMSAVMSVQS